MHRFSQLSVGPAAIVHNPVVTAVKAPRSAQPLRVSALTPAARKVGTYRRPLLVALSPVLPTGQKQSRVEVSTDEWQGTKKVKLGGQIQVMRETSNVDLREATLLEEPLVASSIPNRDMAFDLLENAPGVKALHEVLRIGRVQI